MTPSLSKSTQGEFSIENEIIEGLRKRRNVFKELL